jgi:predicted amidophosphoribosyltransferase
MSANIAAAVTAKKTNDLARARLAREWQTMTVMVRIYCRDCHQRAEGLCPACAQFLVYANARLERCRFGPEKPTCAKCPVHCYQRDRREQARLIMRHAGPRMLWEHPWRSLRHWLDGFRPAPEV